MPTHRAKCEASKKAQIIKQVKRHACETEIKLK